MKDLALVVVSVLLTALAGRTWGHRRLLRQVQEQLALLGSLPAEWGPQRRSLEDLAARDFSRYMKLRSPTMPVHRRMRRRLEIGLLGSLVALFANMSFVPGLAVAKEAATLVGVMIVLAMVIMNTFELVVRGDDAVAELRASRDLES